jgi:hypothetical protein
MHGKSSRSHRATGQRPVSYVSHSRSLMPEPASDVTFPIPRMRSKVPLPMILLWPAQFGYDCLPPHILWRCNIESSPFVMVTLFLEQAPTECPGRTHPPTCMGLKLSVLAEALSLARDPQPERDSSDGPAEKLGRRQP